MTHRLDNDVRDFRGASKKLNGCVLDHPNTDPDVPTLHHVLCLEDTTKIFILTKDVYKRTMNRVNTRPNDRHRILDETLKFTDYLYFTYDVDRKIVDFEKGHNTMDTLVIDGVRLFVTVCMFSPNLDKVHVLKFGELDFSKSELNNLNKVPTPNVAIQCYVAFDFDPTTLVFRPRVHEIRELEIDDRIEPSLLSWNKQKNAHFSYDTDDEDQDVELEISEMEKNGVIQGKRGFVTGLTSVFVPDLPTTTVLLPYHSQTLMENYIGRDSQIDLLYNEVLECYVVLSKKVRPSNHYRTMVDRHRIREEGGVFRVDIQIDDLIYGIFKHQHFKLIADPYGYLDLAHFAKESVKDSKLKTTTIFTLPIKDRLAKVHDSRSAPSIDLVTRFEICGPGDSFDQINFIEGVKSKDLILTTVGIVINAETGRVSSVKYPCLAFRLPSKHGLRPGDIINIRAVRNKNPNLLRPLMKIDDFHRRPETAESRGFKVEMRNERPVFKIRCRYNQQYACYVSDIFGLISCVTPPPPQKKTVDTLYIIEAVENAVEPSQTVLSQGKFFSIAPPNHSFH